MTEKWFDPSIHSQRMENNKIPGYWEDQGIKDLNGVVWYRREIDVPASMTNLQRFFWEELLMQMIYI